MRSEERSRKYAAGDSESTNTLVCCTIQRRSRKICSEGRGLDKDGAAKYSPRSFLSRNFLSQVTRLRRYRTNSSIRGAEHVEASVTSRIYCVRRSPGVSGTVWQTGSGAIGRGGKAGGVY